MNRTEELLFGIEINRLGIEIGPLHKPLCPKREGWNCLVMDFLPSDLLIERYQNDNNVDTSLIEDVDIIYSASLFESLISYGMYSNKELRNPREKLDYIVSSHNFEHQPNPIQFLIDAELLLIDGGRLSMAIPISSRCFDCWRPPTSTGELIDAFYLKKTSPSCGDIFNHTKYHAGLKQSGEALNDANYDLESIEFLEVFDNNYLEHLCALSRQGVYVDAHVSRFNPFSFELIFYDLQLLGLINYLKIEKLIINGSEFIVSIKKDKTLQIDLTKQKNIRSLLAKKSIEFHAKDVGKTFSSNL